MSSFISVAIAVAATLLSGCAYQSTGAYERLDGKVFQDAKTFNDGNQHRIASASHWKLVAENEAKLLHQKVKNEPKITRNSDIAYYIEKNNNSSFSNTYYNLLTSSLVSNGKTVETENKNNNIKITYDVNIVKHIGGKMTPGLEDRDHWPPLYLTAATYYIFSEVAGIIKVPPAVFGEQMIKNLSSAAELVITTKAIQNTQILYSASSVYYIDGINQAEYLKTVQIPPTQQIPQTSSAEKLWNYQFKE
ncbi:MAG: hypothetical protein WCS87_02855 [Methylococcaceae bacterium]